MRPAIRLPTARIWWTSKRRSEALPRRRPGPNFSERAEKLGLGLRRGDEHQYTFIHEVLRVNTLAAYDTTAPSFQLITTRLPSR